MPNWTPQRKLSSKIKWGFKIDPYDPEQIIPIPEMEKLMDIAIKYARGGQYSYRDVAAWLSDASKVDISHVAFYNHYKAVIRKAYRENAAKSAAAAKEKAKASRIRASIDGEHSPSESSGDVREGEHDQPQVPN